MSEPIKGAEHLARRREVLMQGVFKRFQAHWPRAFALTSWLALSDAWLDELGGVDTDDLVPAAKGLLKAAPQYPPKAWDLAKAARRLKGERSAGDAPTGAALRERVWVWKSPVTGRIARASRREDGAWIWHGVDDEGAFLNYADAARIEYVEAMAHEHPIDVAGVR